MTIDFIDPGKNTGFVMIFIVAFIIHISVNAFKQYKLIKKYYVYEIVNILKIPELREKLALWFSSKGNFEKEIYLKSILEGRLKRNKMPQWFFAIGKNKSIIGAICIAQDEVKGIVKEIYVESEYYDYEVDKLLLKKFNKYHIS